VCGLIAVGVIFLSLSNNNKDPEVDRDTVQPVNGGDTPNVIVGNNIVMVKVDSIAGYDSSRFWIGITEITQEQWLDVKKLPKNQVKHFLGRTDKHPIENITWQEAVLFCNALSRQEGKNPCYDSRLNCDPTKNGFRLPTSEEWAMACYGNLQSAYPWGNNWSTEFCVPPIAAASTTWMLQSQTNQVMTKKPNRLGIYDMIGNVSEWCEDPFSGNSQYRTYRGGDWSDWNKTSFESRWEGGLERSDSLPSIGFRIVTTSLN